MRTAGEIIRFIGLLTLVHGFGVSMLKPMAGLGLFLDPLGLHMAWSITMLALGCWSLVFSYFNNVKIDVIIFGIFILAYAFLAVAAFSVEMLSLSFFAVVIISFCLRHMIKLIGGNYGD